jgi:hypothetical protein
MRLEHMHVPLKRFGAKSVHLLLYNLIRDAIGTIYLSVVTIRLKTREFSFSALNDLKLNSQVS